jgi:hypothetical protein
MSKVEKMNIEIINKYSSRDIDTLGKFDAKKKLYFYETLDFHAHRLRTSPYQKLIKKTELPDRGVFLYIEDRDGDGKANMFSYLEKGQQSTYDFGFIFDLNKDGKIDYIVFNGGHLFVKDFKTMMWHNYHWIDSNYDGKIDCMVYNDIDLDGDTFPDKGITAWVWDTDYDGFFDKVEYIGYTVLIPIGGEAWFPKDDKRFKKIVEEKDDAFLIKRAFNRNVKLSTKESIGILEILQDINSNLK